MRTLLAVLALEAGHAISRDDLIEELWAGGAPGNARNALQANVSRLRRVFAEAGEPSDAIVLRSVDNGYLLEVPRDSIDCNRFLTLAARGAALLHTDPLRALAVLQEALQLWHGPALLDTHGGLRCQSATALLDERRLGVWANVINALLATGEEHQAVAELRRLVTHHPLNEQFHEQLMLALYRVGRQSDALDQFHQLRTKLDEELGLAPAERLKKLYSEILTQSHSLLLLRPA
ncbi:BTAD domain-containing putative transcriptional regulator [Nocardia sp. NPDC051570]|uniref:AfsR/SARP family transcriptional regulator n=1 Tax=Nocardia sp. NPDC051570 TaxID=3364324 RepID=UPI0037A91410